MNKKSGMYPIVKVNDPQTKDLKDIKLIFNEVNVRHFEVEEKKEGQEDTTFYSFFTTLKNYGEHCDNYASISED